jgi:hypothetical protein
MVDRMPQPALVLLSLHEAPHFIEFSFWAQDLAHELDWSKLNLDLLGVNLG